MVKVIYRNEVSNDYLYNQYACQFLLLCEVSTLFPWPAVMEKVQYERRKAQFFLMLGILHFNFWLALSK